MKNYKHTALIILLIVLNSINSNSQIGIFTETPLQLLHIDPLQNTNTATPATIKDDVVITTGTGNVGIGTTSPITKLHVSSQGTAASPVSALRIEDGTQKEEMVLTSDAQGKAVWATKKSSFFQLDAFSKTLNLKVGENALYTGFSYDFKEYGTYLIMIGVQGVFSLNTIDDTLLQFRTTISPDPYTVWYSPSLGRIPGTYEIYGHNYYSGIRDKRYYFIQTMTLNASTGTIVHLLLFARNSLPGAANGSVTISLGGTDSITRGGSYVRIN